MNTFKKTAGLLAAAILSLSACGDPPQNTENNSQKNACERVGCATQHRSCDAQTAQCGACLVGYVEHQGACVQSAASCEQLTCQDQHRECVAKPDVAFCGMCVAGYRQGVSGDCELAPTATCDSGFIKERCAARNRPCIQENQGATCDMSACVEGYAQVTYDDLSKSERTLTGCTDKHKLCAARGRAYEESQDQGAPQGMCAACLSGYIEEDGRCRPVKGCQDIDCARGEVCIPSMNQDAACQGNPCRSDQAYVSRTGACIDCGRAARPEGCTESYYPRAAGNESCVCVPEDGWFWDTSAGFNRPVRCDLDGDGWVNTNVVLMRYSGDPVLYEATNKCDLTEISAVTLVNDLGQSKQLLITAPSVAGSSLRDAQGNVRATIVLQETARNDDPALVAKAYQDEELGSLSAAVRDQAYYAELAKSLNPITKRCVDRRSDFNDDGTPDVFDYQSTVRATRDLEVLAKFAHFAELHELSIANGDLTITERRRGQSLPVRSPHERCEGGGDDDGDGLIDCADPDCARSQRCQPSGERCDDGIDNDGDLATDCDDLDCRHTAACDHWTDCHTFREPRFDDQREPRKIGADFAAYSPAFEARAAIDHLWYGMNLSSQFKCLDLQEVLPADPSQRYPNTYEIGPTVQPEPNALRRDFEVISTCAYEPGQGTACKHCKPDPATGAFQCDEATSPTLKTGVYWGARRYTNGVQGGRYTGGCVNECDLSTLERWNPQGGGALNACPGWQFNAATSLTNINQCRTYNTDYGKQYCANNSCEGTTHQVQGAGPSLWLCKLSSVTSGQASSTDRLSDLTPQARQDAPAYLQSIIAPSPHGTNALCQNQDCKTGFTLY